jgi:hypothetical protein
MNKRQWEAALIRLEPNDAAKVILENLECFQGFFNGKERRQYAKDLTNFTEALRAYSALHHNELEKS